MTNTSQTNTSQTMLTILNNCYFEVYPNGTIKDIIFDLTLFTERERGINIEDYIKRLYLFFYENGIPKYSKEKVEEIKLGLEKQIEIERIEKCLGISIKRLSLLIEEYKQQPKVYIKDSDFKK